MEEMGRPKIYDVEGVTPEVAQYFGIKEEPNLNPDHIKGMLPMFDSKFRRVAGQRLAGFPPLSSFDPRLISSVIWSLSRHLGPDPESSRNEEARCLLAELRQKETRWRNKQYQRRHQQKKHEVCRLRM